MGGLPVAGWISARWFGLAAALWAWHSDSLALWRCVVRANQQTVGEAATPGPPNTKLFHQGRLCLPTCLPYLRYLLWQYRWISMRLRWVIKRGKLHSCHWGENVNAFLGWLWHSDIMKNVTITFWFFCLFVFFKLRLAPQTVRCHIHCGVPHPDWLE